MIDVSIRFGCLMVIDGLNSDIDAISLTPSHGVAQLTDHLCFLFDFTYPFNGFGPAEAGMLAHFRTKQYKDCWRNGVAVIPESNFFNAAASSGTGRNGIDVDGGRDCIKVEEAQAEDDDVDHSVTVVSYWIV